jgi:uncharacterized membrane protein
MTKFKQIGIQFADKITSFIGSWTFIVIQSVVVLFWIVLNIVAYFKHFDPYPFILLNLFFSTEAAYATPLILMASSSQSAKDSAKLSKDLEIDSKTQEILLKLYEDIKIDKVSLKDHKAMKKDIEIIKQKIDYLCKK